MSPLRFLSKRKQGGDDVSSFSALSSSSSPLSLLRIRTSSAPIPEISKSSLISLGTGVLNKDGTILSFVPTPESHRCKSRASPDTTKKQMSFGSNTSSAHGSTIAAAVSSMPTPTKAAETVQNILRISCSFLRVGDLGMNEDDHTCTNGSTVLLHSSEGSNSPMSSVNLREPNIHHAAVDPPPGIEMDPKERWIALTTDTDGSYAPIAPIAMDRLANFGFTTSLNQPMWIADSKTDRMLKKPETVEWMKSTFRPGKVHLDRTTTATSTSEEAEVLVWSGSFKHGLYGSDLPAIRAAAIVHMSARSLMELLVDSTRVKEYNKLSLGREDLVTFDGNLETAGPFGKSITKVMKSETRPPLIRKNLVFVSILHAKELVDGSGYLIVTRAVLRPEEEKTMANSIQSEILMGVNLIRKVEGEEDSKCLMINVNHIRSPMVPMMVAKRIGVTSAVGFVNDIRALCPPPSQSS